MRSLFSAGIALSLTGVGVLSTTLAWQNHTTVQSQAQVAQLGVDLGGDANPLLTVTPGQVLLPGRTVRVASGELRNVGTSAFMLDPTNSAVLLDSVTLGGFGLAGVPPGTLPCSTSNFVARLVDDALGDNVRQVQPNAVGSPFHVDMTLAPTAPKVCSNQDVHYTLRVVIRNVAPAQTFGH